MRRAAARWDSRGNRGNLLMFKFAAALGATLTLATAAHAQQPGEAAFRALYKEMV